MAALPEYDEEGKADERLQRWHKHAPGADELDVASHVFAIGLVEAADFGFFLGVGTDFAKVAYGHENYRDGEQHP